MTLTCNLCPEKTFTSEKYLSIHNTKMHKGNGKYECEICRTKFTSKRYLTRHQKSKHDFNKIMYTCSFCGKQFSDISSFKTHKNTHFKKNEKYVTIQKAFNNSCEVIRRILPNDEDTKITTNYAFFHQNNENLTQLLKEKLLTFKNFKCLICVAFNMIKTNSENEIEETMTFYANSETKQITNIQSIKNFLSSAKNRIGFLVDDLIQRGSNWILDFVDFAELKIAKCGNLTGSCFLKKPRIHQQKEILKIKNSNNYIQKEENRKHKHGCFLYAIAAFFKKTDNYKLLDKFIEEKIVKGSYKLPMKLSQIKTFEKKNPKLKLSINVIRYDREEKEFYPYLISKNSGQNKINLLWYQFQSKSRMEKENAPPIENKDIKKHILSKGHFTLITNLNNFFGHHKKRVYCPNCLNFFYSELKLSMHQELCFLYKPQKIILPSKNENIIKFNSWNNKFAPSFMLFYDFEAILPKPNYSCDKCQTNICHHKSKIETNQIPIMFCLIVINRLGKIVHQKTYTGEDCVKVFLDELIQLEIRMKNILSKIRSMKLNDLEIENFNNSNNCHICEKEFDNKQKKVKDHDHLTGKFLGAAHNNCNLVRKEKQFFPVFCHNSKNYDLHFILNEIGKNPSRFKEISGLADNTEKFKVFKLNSFKFLDSAAFLPLSLQTLADDLSKDINHNYSFIKQMNFFNKNDLNFAEKMKNLLKKGIFPYEYMTDLNKLNENSLPPLKEFFSKVSNSIPSQEDYNFALNFFKLFNCETMKDYAELYCKIDTILLVEIIWKFRNEILSDSSLDICNYISLPQLSMDMFLKRTNIEIELLTDSDMLNFIQNSIRGGMSFINQRHVITNEEESMIYIDANNLYGWAMEQNLPLNNYKWEHESNFDKIDWYNIDTEGEKGYILEVDLDYPENLHIAHNSFPLAPEQLDISYDMLSPYAKKCHDELWGGEKYKAKKLTATFNQKIKYAVHFSNLKTYLKLGLKIKKIHRILSFNQAKFVKPHTEYCTNRRINSVSSLQGTIYKLLSNSLFGKFIENVREHINCYFLTNEKKFIKRISNIHFQSFKIINENLVIVFQKKPKVILNKAYPIGFTILEKSKDFMYNFYYNSIVPFFEKTRINFSDTDSFCISINNKNPINIIKSQIDFSNYPKNHPNFSLINKNKLGFFKDELEGKQLTEFIGIRSKTYAMKIEKMENYQKMKGISKGYKKTVSFENYKECINNIKAVKVNQFQIQSKNHIINTMSVNKIAFSSFDDKRYLLCAIHSVPYGSQLIKKFQKSCPFCLNIYF